MKKDRGLTLIELLIVVIIIGILTSLIFANFAGIRYRGRDSQRKSDVQQIRSALEIYRADTRSYPTTLPSCGGALTFGTTIYMQKIPCDPLGEDYIYAYTLGSYTLYACLENTSDSARDGDDGSANDKCTTTGRVSYTVQNP